MSTDSFYSDAKTSRSLLVTTFFNLQGIIVHKQAVQSALIAAVEFTSSVYLLHRTSTGHE